MSKTITISDRAQELSEKRVKEEGFENIESYIDTLVEGDAMEVAITDALRKKLEEGLASPDAGELTREKFDRLVEEGTTRTTHHARQDH